MTLLCVNNVAPFHIFSKLLFCVRARYMQITYTQTHPSLFSLLDHAISFNFPTKFAGKSRRARRGEAASTRRGASRSCHTVHKRIVRIFGVIYSRLHAIAFHRNFLFSLTMKLAAQKTTVRTTDIVRIPTRGCEINAPRKSVVLSRNKQ